MAEEQSSFLGIKLGAPYKIGKIEQERRKASPVQVKWAVIGEQLKEKTHVFVVDPRLGFNNRTHRLWYNRLAPHEEEGGHWKTLGHRHTVEAVIYFLTGFGHSIVDGIRYDWKAGDMICVPMFAWHRHIVESDEEVLRIASTTNPLSISLGQALYEDEDYPEYWIFAQESEAMQKTLIPGGSGDVANVETTDTSAGRLYAEQVGWAMREEGLRRKSKVLVKGSELKYEKTAMGDLAYMVDPRIGFHTKAIAAVMARVPGGRHSGAHRHLYDEIDLVVKGRGKAIIDDKEYEVSQGDVMAIPIWAWHQYFNTGTEPLQILAISTRPALENLGLVLTHHGELADH